jgi:small subunit ribosomal protein S18
MTEEKSTTKPTGHIDYKNVTKLRNHINPHARMFGRKRTNFTAKEQRNFAKAIKRARFMSLLPYVNY